MTGVVLFKGKFFVVLTILLAFGMLGCSSPSCPRRRASRRGALWIAGVLDSRLRGNDNSALRVVKNLPLKGWWCAERTLPG